MFALAVELRRLPEEIRAMPHSDYVGLVEFYGIRAMWADLHDRAARQKGR